MSWQTFRCFVSDVQTDAGRYFKTSYESCHILSVSLCNHQVIRPCKTWIKKESLKPQKIGHHDRFFMVYPNLFIYSFALWPSKSLGLLNNGSPFFPIGCLLSPSLNLHLPQILLQKFQPSRSRSNPSSSSLRFTLRFFINCPSLTGSYYMSGPFQYFFLYIYICYWAASVV